MSRRYCIVCGIMALLAAGCEEGDSSGGGGRSRAAVNKASAASASNIAVADSGTSGGVSEVFLPSPSFTPQANVDAIGTVELAETSVRDGGGSSAPTIGLGSIAGSVDSSASGASFIASTDSIIPFNTLASNDTRVPSANAVAANPEPVTAMLSLMGLGALGMATRRRTA